MEEKEAINSKHQKMVKADTVWTWMKIIIVVSIFLLSGILALTFYFQYNQIFGIEDFEESASKTKIKELTPSEIQNNTDHTQNQKASASFAMMMTGRPYDISRVDSMIETYDKADKRRGG